jgi:hypothetical protein
MVHVTIYKLVSKLVHELQLITSSYSTNCYSIQLARLAYFITIQIYQNVNTSDRNIYPRQEIYQSQRIPRKTMNQLTYDFFPKVQLLAGKPSPKQGHHKNLHK